MLTDARTSALHLAPNFLGATLGCPPGGLILTFGYLHQFTWLRVVGWLRRKHRRANWKWLRRRYLANRWWPEHDGMALFDCRAVPVTRYRYRGAAIPTPWNGTTTTAA